MQTLTSRLGCQLDGLNNSFDPLMAIVGTNSSDSMHADLMLPERTDYPDLGAWPPEAGTRPALRAVDKFRYGFSAVLG
jgi:hypothetical protein